MRLPDVLDICDSQFNTTGLELAGAGLWRVRGCARKRDEADAAGIVLGVDVEEHEFSAWPVSKLEKIAVIKGSDRMGASMGRR